MQADVTGDSDAQQSTNKGRAKARTPPPLHWGVWGPPHGVTGDHGAGLNVHLCPAGWHDRPPSCAVASEEPKRRIRLFGISQWQQGPPRVMQKGVRKCHVPTSPGSSAAAGEPEPPRSPALPRNTSPSDGTARQVGNLRPPPPASTGSNKGRTPPRAEAVRKGVLRQKV